MLESRIFLTILVLLVFSESVWAYGDSVSGVATLQSSSNTTMRAKLPADVRPLLTGKEQETYLLEIEDTPPPWDSLHHQPEEEHGARLFDFNRARDDRREGHPLLKQRLAFVWSGILRKYDPAHQGFTIAIGPQQTLTSWGIMRFKPMGLPNDMVVIPPPHLLTSFKQKIINKEEIEIDVLFFGTLVPNESIMYAFSHDGNEEGMIMPFVQVDKINYFIRE